MIHFSVLWWTEEMDLPDHKMTSTSEYKILKEKWEIFHAIFYINLVISVHLKLNYIEIILD